MIKSAQKQNAPFFPCFRGFLASLFLITRAIQHLIYQYIPLPNFVKWAGCAKLSLQKSRFQASSAEEAENEDLIPKDIKIPRAAKIVIKKEPP